MKIRIGLAVFILTFVLGCTTGSETLESNIDNTPPTDVTELDSLVVQERPPVFDDVVIHETLSSQVTRKPAPEFGFKGHGTGLVRESDVNIPSLERPQNFEFHIDRDEEFSPLLILVNFTSDDAIHLVSFLADYRQISFEMDGVEGTLHEVVVPANTELVVPVNIGRFKPGAHDLQVVVSVDPYESYGLGIVDLKTVTVEQILALNNDHTSKRMVLIVDSVEIPDHRFGVDGRGDLPTHDNPTRIEVYFSKAGTTHPFTETNENVLLFDEAEAGSTYKLRILTSNYEDSEPVSRAISLFLDHTLIPVNGQDAFLVQLDPGEEYVFDVEFELPEIPGEHQLTAWVTPNPYERWKGEGHWFGASGSTGQVIINTR